MRLPGARERAFAARRGAGADGGSMEINVLVSQFTPITLITPLFLVLSPARLEPDVRSGLRAQSAEILFLEEDVRNGDDIGFFAMTRSCSTDFYVGIDRGISCSSSIGMIQRCS